MNIAPLLRLDAVVSHVVDTGAADEFGDPTETVTTATYKAWYHQEQRSELTGNQDTQREAWIMYLPPAAADAVFGGDRVAIGGNSYELDGPPWTVTHPITLAVSHVESRIVRTT